MPRDSIYSIPLRTKSGARAYNARDPSSGGNGIMLNKKNVRLTNVKTTTKPTAAVGRSPPKSWSTRAPNSASNRLVTGPATPTSAAPSSPHLTFDGSNGTGFAIPNGGAPSATSISGSKTVVNKSMWANGLNVRRPWCLAVSSPSQYPVNACAASCRVIEIRIETSAKTSGKISNCIVLTV